jgi:hypothetical protein
MKTALFLGCILALTSLVCARPIHASGDPVPLCSPDVPTCGPN